MRVFGIRGNKNPWSRVTQWLFVYIPVASSAGILRQSAFVTLNIDLPDFVAPEFGQLPLLESLTVHGRKRKGEGPAQTFLGICLQHP